MDRRQILIAIPALLAGATGPAAGKSSTTSPNMQWRLDTKPVLTGLNAPVGMAYDSAGALYIANWASGTIDRLEGNGRCETFVHGLNGPSGLAVAADGDLFVASYYDDLVWRIKPNGERSVFVKNLATPAGLSFEPSGRLLIANRRTNQILAVEPDGRLVAVAERLQTPVGAVRFVSGELVVSNIDGGITVIDGQGKMHAVTGAVRQPGPGIVLAADDAVFVADYGGTRIHHVSLSGRVDTIVDGLRSPVGLAVSPQGDLMVTTWGDNALFRIRRIAQ